MTQVRVTYDNERGDRIYPLNLVNRQTTQKIFDDWKKAKAKSLTIYADGLYSAHMLFSFLWAVSKNEPESYDISLETRNHTERAFFIRMCKKYV